MSTRINKPTSQKRSNFGISHSELGKYSTTEITMDEDFAKNYSSEIVESAKELKAKNGDKYSDEYYLNYAKSLKYQELLRAHREINQRSANQYDITDKDWAMYSYEEIIEMEHQGYQIPDDILEWAHAQQESDVTDYVIVSDATGTDDGATTDATSNGDQLTSLQKKAQENIIKSEKAIETTNQKVEVYNTTAKKAKQIKDKKEDTFKDSMNKIEDMTTEWKKLDDKKKNGEKLSLTERLKYNSLSKKLDTSNGTMMKEIQADNSDLDDFLNSLDSLSADIKTNETLAQDTIKSGKDLSNLQKNYRQEELPAQTSGIKDDGMGPSLDELYQAKPQDIADTAIDKGNDLLEYVDEVTLEVESNATVDTAKFAQEYTELSEKTQEKVQNTMGEDQDDNNDKKQKQESYDVDLIFTAENARKATKTTIKSTANLNEKKNGVKNTDKKLATQLKKAQKDAKTVEKESSKAEQKHEDNVQKEEQLVNELENIQGKSLEGSTSEKVKNAIKSVNTQKQAQNNTDEMQNDLQNEGDGQVQAKVQTATKQTDKNEAEKLAVMEEIKAVDTDDNKVNDSVKTSLTKGLASNALSQKISNDLNKQNTELKSRNTNAQQVAANTIIVGLGTYGKSFLTRAYGKAMTSTGFSLMHNVLTNALGVKMVYDGTKISNQGAKENHNGLESIEVGAIGLAVSGVASLIFSDTKNSFKGALSLVNTNKKSYQEIAKSLGATVSIQNPENNATTENKTEDSAQTTETQSTENSVQNDESKSQDVQTEQPQDQQNPEQVDNQAESIPQVEVKTENQDETSNEDNSNNETQNSTSDKKKSNQKDYSVATEFTSKNAISATSTTIRATQDLTTQNSDINKQTTTVDAETKKSINIVKTIEKDSTKAQAEQRKNAEQTQTIVQQTSAAKAKMNNAQSTEEAEAAQNETVALETENETLQNENSKEIADTEKSLTKNIQQLDGFKKTANELNKNTTSHKKLASDQLDTSTKTILVGAGTTGFGILHTAYGANMIASGMALMANPFTHTLGVLQVALGQATLATGAMEVSTGAVATNTGIVGTTVNAHAKTLSSDATNSTKASLLQSKDSDKKVQNTTKDLELSIKENDDNTQQIDNETNNEPTDQNSNSEDDNTDDTNLVSASVSTNANINNTTKTDDKEDRKLARFNTDSMIESKKKKKKVQAVSATFTNRKK